MSVNKWLGIGNLTKDPETRYTPQGTAVCNFSIACNERYKDRDGQQQEKVEFVNIVVWKNLAEICSRYLHKGKQVYIEGKLSTRKWQDKEGSTRYSTEVIASEMQMLGSKDDGHGNGQQNRYQQENDQQYTQRQAQPTGQQPTGQQQSAYGQQPAQPHPQGCMCPDCQEIPF